MEPSIYFNPNILNFDAKGSLVAGQGFMVDLYNNIVEEVVVSLDDGKGGG